MSNWRSPTKYLQRLGDAIELLCSGHRPPDEMMERWLDSDADDMHLQSFCAEHGPIWAQGIGIIDAAQVLANQPTEGVDHEMYNLGEKHAR